MIYVKYIALIVFSLISFLGVDGETINFHVGNKFRDFSNNKGVEIIGRYLLLDNLSAKPMFNVQPIDISGDYDFMIRLANLHNMNNKGYSLGFINKTSDTECGIVWNYKDEINYMAVSLKCDNDNLYDSLDERFMNLKVIEVKNGKSRIVYKIKIKDNVDLYRGNNVVKIEKRGNQYTVLLGNRYLNEYYKYECDSSCNNMGYYAGSCAKVEVERIVVDYIEDLQQKLATEWNQASLNARFKTSTDIYEGYWDYLDRNIKNKNIDLGGKYRLALVKNNDNSYDILYISGSEYNVNTWEIGMLKGKLRPTRFVNHYNLEWNDAVMNNINDETYCDIVDNVILKLEFPLYGSTLRFVKSDN